MHKALVSALPLALPGCALARDLGLQPRDIAVDVASAALECVPEGLAERDPLGILTCFAGRAIERSYLELHPGHPAELTSCADKVRAARSAPGDAAAIRRDLAAAE